MKTNKLPDTNIIAKFKMINNHRIYQDIGTSRLKSSHLPSNTQILFYGDEQLSDPSNSYKLQQLQLFFAALLIQKNHPIPRDGFLFNHKNHTPNFERLIKTEIKYIDQLNVTLDEFCRGMKNWERNKQYFRDKPIQNESNSVKDIPNLNSNPLHSIINGYTELSVNKALLERTLIDTKSKIEKINNDIKEYEVLLSPHVIKQIQNDISNRNTGTINEAFKL